MEAPFRRWLRTARGSGARGMTLRRKTFLIFGATIIGLTALLYICARAVLLQRFATLENDFALKDVARARDAFASALAELDSRALDWANWDDTATFVEGSNPNYEEDNLNDESLANIRINLVAFLDREARIVWAGGVDYRERQRTQSPAYFRATEPLQGDLWRQDDSSNGVTGLLVFPEGAFLLAVRPILSSEAEGPAHGTLVMGRLLDNIEIQELSRLTHLDLALGPVDATDPAASVDSPGPNQLPPGAADVALDGPLKIHAKTVLTDIYGQSALTLCVTIPRAIYQQGQTGLRYLVIAVLAAGLAAGTLTLVLLERLVLRRVAALSTEVQAIGRRGDFLARVHCAGTDELAQLGAEINRMLGSLELSHQELRARIDEIERFNRLAVQREQRMISLKQEVNALSQRLAEPPPYQPHSFDDPVNEAEGAAANTREEPTSTAPDSADDYPTCELAALLDLPSTQSLLNGFCDSVGVAAALVDLQGHVLVGARWQPLCTDFHRVNQHTLERCIESDTRLAAQLQAGERFSFYQCRNGLTDAAAPVIIAGRHVANAFVGQFLLQEPDEVFFRNQAATHGFRPEPYIEALRRVPIVPRHKLPAILGFLSSFAELVGRLALERLQAHQANAQSAHQAREIAARNRELDQQRQAAINLAEDADRARMAAESSEVALRESEARYRSVSENAQDAIVTYDVSGRVCLWNPAAERMFGYTAAEMLGQSLFDRIIPTERREAARESAAADFASAASGSARCRALERMAQRKSGETFPVDLSLTVNRERDGLLAVAVIRDISERKRAEQQLHEQAALLKSRNMVLEAQRGQLQAQQAELMATNCALEEARRTADVANRALQTANQELDAHSKQLHAQQQDLVQLNQELQHAVAAAQCASHTKSEFLANMSHEIRTPMTAILGFADIALEHAECAGVAPEHIDAIQTIKSNGEHLLALINDILDLSKIEAGKLAVEEVACSPAAIVADVVAMMNVRAQTKGLTLTTAWHGAIPEHIRSDPTRLRQILVNLVGNAIKFTEVGNVSLTAHLTGDGQQSCLHFDVADTGIGMTSDQVTGLFQPFVQADTSTTRRFGGTGLGLTISKRLAEMLGGDVALVETRLGVGTRMRLTVATGPLAEVRLLNNAATSAASDPLPSQTAPADEQPLSGLRILLAEDGPDNQRLVAYILRKAGAAATVVENGQVAVNAVLAARETGSPFDVVLMDMQMPAMDGYEATRLLRDAGCNLPIIALTAHAMEGDRQRCIDAGCNAYTTKPIKRRELVELVRLCVEQQPQPAP